MTRRGKSQWEFGELFPADPPKPTRQVLSVSQLTTQVRHLIEQEVGEVWVTGEVTNVRMQSSGHVYFTLKDATAQLSCVLFRTEAARHREYLQDGQKVLLQGGLTVYEPRGQYQLIVRVVEPQGVGVLQLAFEKLKRRLQAEGLFAQERKRPLPRFPQRLGLVTSPTGAAIRDVLHVIARRNPSLHVILVPCRVQGEGAAGEIAAGIRRLNEWNATLPAGERVDLILVTRGGGSLEDLWAFNEEVVARAIFESALPVVSAVGHEIDFTISDFVADLRAATPSAAAEIITEGMFAARQSLIHLGRKLRQSMLTRLERAQAELRALAQRRDRVHPRRLVHEQLQRLDDYHAFLLRQVRHHCRLERQAWMALRQRLTLVRPTALIARRREGLRDCLRRLGDGIRQATAERKARLGTLQARLQLLGPENVLARGYSITLDEATGRVIRVAAETRAGQRLRTRLREGEVRSVIDNDKS